MILARGHFREWVDTAGSIRHSDWMLATIMLAGMLTQSVPMRASWYGIPHHGRRTANGERFDMNASTCAHKTLPMGVWLELTFRSHVVWCRVNDRGPYIKGRDLDVSRAVAQQLDMLQPGVAVLQTRKLQ